MPTFLISAIFWQVTFCAVIWTLEKRYKKKCWCHVCFSKKVFVPEGHMTRRSSRKARDLASGWGEGWRYRKHSALQECPVSMQAVAHLGRHSRPRLTGSSLKHKGGVSRDPVVPLPCKQAPFKFVMVSIPATCGIKTTSWNCTSAARINVFSPFQEKKWQCSYVTFAHWTLLNE